MKILIVFVEPLRSGGGSLSRDLVRQIGKSELEQSSLLKPLCTFADKLLIKLVACKA